MTLRLNGDSSGFTEIKAPNEAGDNSITLPDSNGGANQILKNSTTAGELQFASEVLIDHNNRLLVGNTESQGVNSELQVRKDFDGRSLEIFRSFDSNSTPGRIQFSTSRGTASSSTAMQDGGKISEIRFTGHDGTNFIPAAEISSDVSGAPGTNVMPGRLIFSTNSGGSSVTDRVEIGSNGALKLLAGCPGIDFSRIQTNQAGMASETLANYERGSFTPSFENISAFDYSARTGSYVRVGEIVTVYIRLSTINAGAVSGTQTVKITGLPFPVRFSGNAGLNCLALTHDDRFVNNPQYGQVQAGSQTKIVLFKDQTMKTANGLTSADFTKTNSANFNLMSINFTYEIDLS